MDKSEEDFNGLRSGKFEKRRPTFFKIIIISVYIKMTFTQLENHSQLLCCRDFANDRLVLWTVGAHNYQNKQNYLK